MLIDKARDGRRNLRTLYAYTGVSRLWFDGGLWFIYWQHRGISVFEVGILEAILHIVALVSDVPLGIFADRLGWKVALAASSLSGVAYTAVALVAQNFWMGVLAFSIRGLQVTLANGSDASIAYESAQWAGQTDRYLAISGRLFAIALISMGIAESISGTVANWSWAALYLAYMGANLLSFFVVLGIREPREFRVMEQRPPAYAIAREAIRFARHSRPFTKWILLSGTLSGVLATFAFYGQTLLLHAGWTLIGIGILSGVENGVGAFASLSAAKAVDRLGERTTIGLSGLLAMVGLLIFGWLPGPSAGIGFLINSVAGSLADPIIDQGLNRIVPTHQRATLLSINSTAFSVFMIVVFPLFGLLIQRIGLVHAAYVGSAVGSVAILFALAWWWKGHQGTPITSNVRRIQPR